LEETARVYLRNQMQQSAGYLRHPKAATCMLSLSGTRIGSWRSANRAILEGLTAAEREMLGSLTIQDLVAGRIAASPEASERIAHEQ
jgi:hypothetical protein